MEIEGSPKVQGYTGIGTGMLTAVVAASLTSAVALLQVAPDVIGIALRLGTHASRRSRLVEGPSALSWARQMVVEERVGDTAGVGVGVVGVVSSALDAFHAASVRSSVGARGHVTNRDMDLRLLT